MNVLHMKYAVEVARIGSINRAAEELYVAQPNLSRSIKELENELGITIFDRSSKGMFLTGEGEEFILYAKKILQQIDALEKKYKTGAPVKQRFSISVPRASYISNAFARFSKHIDASSAEVFYMETNASTAINNIISNDYKLGVIRYAESYDKYFQKKLEEKGLTCEVLAEFHYVLVMNPQSPLALKEAISYADLHPLLEITHGDPYVPSLPMNVVMKEEQTDVTDRHIFLFERGSQFDLLTENPETFMWVSPLPNELLERYHLLQKECVDNTRIYRDALIYKKNYTFSSLDRLFIDELMRSKHKYL